MTDHVPSGPLIHIGYHKTGSTWLQRSVFANQPGLAVVDRDEVVAAFVDREPFTDVEFERLGGTRRMVISHERLSGHPFSGGFDSDVIAARLAEAFPAARILIVIRHQPDMLRAIYAQYVRRGGPLPLRRFVADSENWHRQPHFRFDFLEYDRLINRYQQLFGAERVTTLPYELLQADQAAFLAGVAAFAEQPMAAAEPTSVNASMSSAALPVNRFANRLVSNPGFNRSAAIVNDRIYGRVGKAIRAMDTALPAAVSSWATQRHQDDIAAIVGDRYRSSNTRTAQLIGTDLANFGWLLG